ncbi:MAG: hypothetical protein JXR64_10140 [Spirochaetales bacterium]|nr:hypothetical protein [Spirochaetales bacterium]
MKKIINGLFIGLILIAVGCVSAPETKDTAVDAIDEGSVRLHYQRMDNDYTGWGLHIWGAGYDGDTVNWGEAVMPTGSDDYGVYWDIPFNGEDDLNFIIHNGDTKDPDGDRAFTDLDMYNEFWAVSGDSELYTSAEDAL